jgi:hypothetical protein
MTARRLKDRGTRQRPAPQISPSAHLRKFVSHRRDHFHELRKVRGTSKLMILVPLFYLTFLARIRREWCRNVK